MSRRRAGRLTGVLVAAISPAFANIVVLPNPIVVSAVPGAFVVFSATVSPDLVNHTVVNYLSFSYDSPAANYLFGDPNFDANFVSSVVLTTDLPAFEPIFDIQLALNTQPGIYTGTVELRGDGSGNLDTFANDPLVTIGYQIDVVAAEPGTIVLLTAALSGIAALRRRFQHRMTS